MADAVQPGKSGEKRSGQRSGGKCIGITEHLETERNRKAEQIGPDPWAVRKVAMSAIQPAT